MNDTEARHNMPGPWSFAKIRFSIKLSIDQRCAPLDQRGAFAFETPATRGRFSSPTLILGGISRPKQIAVMSFSSFGFLTGFSKGTAEGFRKQTRTAP